MDLRTFDLHMEQAARFRREADVLLRRADVIEIDAIKRAGITHVDREPSFPCWQINELPDYYSTPREALLAKSRLQ